MSAIQVTSINVLNNPCGFLEAFQFEITFEANQELQEDLEWRVTYVGSADSESFDQVLDSVLVGPVPLGTNRFLFEAPSPDPKKIPQGDLLGVTVVLLECLYRDKVFVRVGYYVSNENPDEPAPGTEQGASKADDGMDIVELDTESEGEADAEGEGDDDMDLEEETEMAKENVEVKGLSQQALPTKKESVNIPPERIRRVILSDKPRVTRFPIEWDAPRLQQDQQQLQDGMIMTMDEERGSAMLNSGF